VSTEWIVLDVQQNMWLRLL